ncbi:hypothetical protein [Microcoleus sp. D3_18a_C4]|uniref:hypothetical protein n=1 Tax=unclassified Microcoleus TaxID=2642155 RepID=UPI002FD54AF9
MRHIRILALGIVSFFAFLMSALLAPGTIVNRALSAALCTVFSFNSTICTVNLANWSDRVVAATPPAVERNISDWLVQRAPGEFDDAPSVRPGSNPQAPPFPQDPGPNQPLRPDFDNSNAPNRPQSPNPSIPVNSQSPRSGTRRNNSSLVGTRKIAPDRLETQFVTGEGCRVNKIFRVINKEQIFQESIQIIAPDNNTCGGVSYSYQFQPDGKQIDIEAGSDVKFTFVDDNPFIELRYDISGKKGVLRFDPNRNSTSQNLVLASNLLSPNSTKKKLLPVTNKEPAILIANTTILVAENDPRINANDLGLGNDPSVLKDVDEKLREMGGPAERILRPLVREICQAGEDITNKTLDAATGDATDLALDAALEKAVKDSSEYKILKLIKKVKDNWDTITQLITKGINFDNLQEIARERLKSSFENMLKSRRLGLNCEKFDYNPDADRVITEGCTVCTCCVYTAQYKYSHNGQVSGGTFNAPCKGSIEQIVAKINSDLARDMTRRQLPYTATVVGTPQRNTQPPPECDGSLQTAQQQLRNCRVTGVEKYNNMTMNRGGCAIQGPVMTEDGPVDGKTQCGICNTFIGGLAPRAGSCQEGVETDPRIAFLGLNKPILCPPNWDSGY